MINDPDFYKNVLDNLYDGVYFVDLDRRITYWNRGAEKLTGYRSSEVVGNRCADNILTHVNEEGVGLCEKSCPLEATMTGGSRCEAEVYLLHRDGHRLPVLIRAAPLTDEKGEIIGAVEVFSDNAARLALAHRVQDLQKKALLDSLTDLPNRRFIEMQLRSKLDEMERYGFPFGVFFIDIDHFKEINDRNGHDVGDKVLQMLARTMNNSLRPFDVLGRWGGEEFVAVTPNVDADALSTIGNRLRSLVEKSRFTAGSRVIRVTVSIGATLSKRDDSEEELIKRADQLMYQSKAAGRNRLSI